MGRHIAVTILALWAATGSGVALGQDAARADGILPAVTSTAATRAAILGAAKAGQRIIGVGDHGVVVLSDDGGRSFRQASRVPVSSTLTSVSFVDARHGWAAGHRGVVLATDDGGENWRIQRVDTSEDRPMFGIHFFDQTHGVAIGLWSLVLTTDDGGATWVRRELAPPAGAKRADLNLLGLFSDDHERVFATAERGMVLVSVDRGRTWRYLSTGYKGSLWCGIALTDGSMLVGGQRGTLLRSEDAGATWSSVALHAKSSVTAMAASNGQVWAVGLDGMLASSDDGGRHFDVQLDARGASLTAVAQDGGGLPVRFSQGGVIPMETGTTVEPSAR